MGIEMMIGLGIVIWRGFMLGMCIRIGIEIGVKYDVGFGRVRMRELRYGWAMTMRYEMETGIGMWIEIRMGIGNEIWTEMGIEMMIQFWIMG